MRGRVRPRMMLVAMLKRDALSVSRILAGLMALRGPINIEPSDIIIPERCPVLGIPLVAGAGLKSGNTPTLDCIDPSKGYVRGNIEVVSWRFNKLKSDLTPDEMRRIAAWVLR